MYNVVWRYAVARGLLRPDVDPEGVRRASRGYLIGPIAYTAITLIALVNAWISLALLALLALYWLLRASGPRPSLIRSSDESDLERPRRR